MVEQRPVTFRSFLLKGRLKLLGITVKPYSFWRGNTVGTFFFVWGLP
jgi:hypothetical protein